MQEIIYKFIKPDLLVLIPVLFLVGNFLKKSLIKDYHIPFIIGILGIIFSVIWTLSTSNVFGLKGFLTAIFVGFCQGILVAGASVFVKQLNLQLKKST